MKRLASFGPSLIKEPRKSKFGHHRIGMISQKSVTYQRP